MTPEQIEKLVDHVRFDKFSKNESVNYTKEIKAGVGKDDPNNTFVRKGISITKLAGELLLRSK